MAKSKNAVRTNITVPSDLKRRMDRCRDTNWSAVASRAFEAELDAIAELKKGLNMAAIRARLLSSKESEKSERYLQGFDYGVEWAKTTAEYSQLEGLAQLRDSLAGESPDFDDYFQKDSAIRFDHRGLPGWLADAILGPDCEDDEMGCLWESAFGDDAEEMLEDYEVLHGFCCGALDLFEKAGV